MARKSIRVKKANPQTPAVPVDYTLESITGAVTVSTLNATLPAGDWQLASGHYTPAKMEPLIIHPRPDVETNAWERHRLAPSATSWRIPIAVRGGSYPFLYSVDATSAAKGISIGSQFVASGDVLVAPDDYGILSWASPTVGTHTITVTVTTQEDGRGTSGFGTETSVTFTLSVVDREDTTKFVWIDSVSGSDANDGSFSAPVQTFQHPFNNMSTSGKQVHLKAGAYNLDEIGGLDPYYFGSTRSGVIVGAGRDVTQLRFTDRALKPVASGFYFGEIEMVEAGWGSTVGSAKYININDLISRVTVFSVRLENPANGTIGSENPGMIYTSDSGGAMRDYFTLWDIIESGNVGATTNSHICTLYATQNIVAENLNWSGSAGQGFSFKDSNRYSSVRRCVGHSTGAFCVNYQAQATTLPYSEQAEYCYNKLYTQERGYRTFNGLPSQAGEVWTYRNTIICPGTSNYAIENKYPDSPNHGPVYYENNVIQIPSALYIRPGPSVIESGNIEGTSGLVDANKNLAGATRTNYLGTKGAEIA